MRERIWLTKYYMWWHFILDKVCTVQGLEILVGVVNKLVKKIKAKNQTHRIGRIHKSLGACIKTGNGWLLESMIGWLMSKYYRKTLDHIRKVKYEWTFIW